MVDEDKTQEKHAESDEVDQRGWPVRLIRRLFVFGMHLVWRFVRPLTLGVRVAVIDKEDRVFLIRHTYMPGWYLPGGGVESGETVLEALARELREEACLQVMGTPVFHGIFLNKQASKRDHVLIYVVREFEILAEKKPDWEIAEAGFFPLSALPPQTTPATHRRLDEIMKNRPIAPYW